MQLARTLFFILLDTDEAMVMDAFMISSLDYYNSLSLGMKPQILKKLQMVQTQQPEPACLATQDAVSTLPQRPAL